MPIYLYWGEDDFALGRAVEALRDRTLDPQWASFNYDKIPPDELESVIQGLNQALTPPFGSGGRFVWLVDTPLFQSCSEDLYTELERSLSAIPETTTLLLTGRTKPNGRLKSTKLLTQHAQIQEYAAIPPWKTDRLVQQVRQAAQDLGLALTPASQDLIAEAVGNNTRQLYNELEKLRLFSQSCDRPLDVDAVAALITTSTQNSLQLAAAIRQGNTPWALELVSDLLGQNEPALRIVATLVGQFRTWLWVKLMMAEGERDERAIAQAAEVSNPKRIYFLQQEVRSLSLTQLQQTLPLLLELEVNLKRGAEELTLLQTKVVELCQLYKTGALV
ncbi:DNA polymerase III subunit delta [Geitlerinema sp. PCC 7407]|uniref:DNA polymerase III subunit delta n=1 Tax=Geitlerinema sp. PCC 7407 TaxID=1173025 RepID=UPI00029FFBD8|nr:DNA polymerase III subunit delta [Geitlerinema sp. PCC 7407]AFY65959.1 DNA polymerase III, delta subunit [Geitlerinema sp. PCC 7407]